jgi:2-phospho-L-lactate guanylyltransferase
MRAILIPVKSLASAKQRLAGTLPQEERTRLAQAMLEDVFAAVAGVASVQSVFVVSSDTFAMAAAERRGWVVLPEREQISESDSVDRASRLCAARGVTALLRVPIDIPLARAQDFEALLAATPDAPGAVLVPSWDGQGTNALLRTPPDLFPSHFGPGSLAKHLAEARRLGARVELLRNPRIELDVDEEEDLRRLLASEGLAASTAALRGSLLARSGA